jgi:rhodanese-related sulfurtransferase
MNIEPITSEEAKGRLTPAKSSFFSTQKRGGVAEIRVADPALRRLPPDHVEAHLDDVPLADLIVPYAASAEDASKVARQLAEYGWPNVRPLLGGHEGWHAAGYPTESKAPHKLTPEEALSNLQKAEGE